MRATTTTLLDTSAIGASWLCLAHCLLLPLAIAVMPALAGTLAVPEWFHIAVLAFALPVSAAALLPRHDGHWAWVPLSLAVIGFAALIGGVTVAHLPLAETGLTVLGSLLLASAHIANWRARRAG